MNEWYARDTSRKIQSTFKSKGENGKHTASSPPYGYIKDKKDKDKWIVDEEAAEIVRRIFNLTVQGNGSYRIAKIFEVEKIEIEKKKIRLTESKNRLQKQECLMCRIYKDMILEKIPNARYEILNNQYETE